MKKEDNLLDTPVDAVAEYTFTVAMKDVIPMKYQSDLDTIADMRADPEKYVAGIKELLTEMLLAELENGTVAVTDLTVTVGYAVTAEELETLNNWEPTETFYEDIIGEIEM